MRKLSGTRFDSRPLARGRVSIEPVAGRSARLRRHLLVCQGRSERKRRDRCVTRTEEDDDQVPTANGAGPQPESTIRGRGDLACLGAAVIAAASGVANPAARDRPNLQKDLDALVAAGAPGAVLLVRNQNHTVRYTAGLADVTNKRPMRAVDRFRIASLTKTYTATVVLQLVAEGRLHLDDSVEQHLPGLVPNGGEIKIRQLLNHTSGLFDYEHDQDILKPYYAGDIGHYWSMRQLVEHAVAHKPLFTPGAG